MGGDGDLGRTQGSLPQKVGRAGALRVAAGHDALVAWQDFVNTRVARRVGGATRSGCFAAESRLISELQHSQVSKTLSDMPELARGGLRGLRQDPRYRP